MLLQSILRSRLGLPPVQPISRHGQRPIWLSAFLAGIHFRISDSLLSVTVMDDPFESPRMLIESAEERITGLEQIIKAFIGHEGRTYGAEFDLKAGKHSLYVQYPVDIPRKISVEIRAVALELRDALDHTVYASSVTLFGGDPDKTKFLVADTEEGIQHDIKRNRCKDVHENVVALMVRENACKTGNRTIWSLNQFRNRNSHRVVSLASAGVGGIGIGRLRSDGLTLQTMNEWRSTSRRLYYARIEARGSNFELDIHPTIGVRIHPRFGFGDRPANIELRTASAEVRRLLDLIETETIRISGK